MTSGLVITKASAGSGKTFNLVYHYLLLALANPDDFDGILGITFTNKAAAEMKNRALEELKNLAEGKDTFYRKLLTADLGITSDMLTERARYLQHLMLHRFYQIRFSTIDTLLQTLLRHLARELGLSASYALETDAESIKKELLTRFFRQLDQDAQARQWLMEYINERLNEKKSWDLERTVSQFLDQLFDENSREIFKHHWPDLNKARKLKDLVDEEIEKITGEWTQMARAFNEHLSQHGLDLSVLNSRHAYAVLLKRFTEAPARTGSQLLSDLQECDRAEALRDIQGETLEPKKSINAREKQRFYEAMAAGLAQVFDNWRQCVFNHYPRFKTLLNIRKELHRYGLLGAFASVLEHWKAETHTQLIQDAPRILADLFDTGDAGFIYEKTSQKIRHILIDEFQDTSLAQWRSLMPLMEEVLAAGNMIYVVGDPKQSIYGWRGAQPVIMQQELPLLASRRGYPYHQQVLQDNFRSAPEIVTFNNHFFRLLVQHFPALLRKSLKFGFASRAFDDAVSLLQHAYEALEQKTGEKNESLKGHVEVVWLRETKNHKQYEENAGQEQLPPEEENVNEPPGDLAALSEACICNTLNRWHDEGFSPHDIVLLVRSNKEVDEHVALLNRLIHKGSLRFREAKAVSNASWNFENSRLSSYALALLRYASEPNQYYHKAMAFYHARISEGIARQQAALEVADSQKVEDFVSAISLPGGKVSAILRHIRDAYLLDKIQDNVEKERETAYLHRLMDFAYEFEKTYASTLSGFLSWLDEKKPEVSPGLIQDKNLIRVATIHSVKGLEFQAVLLSLSPSGAFEKNNNDIVWYPVKDSITQNQEEFFPFRCKSHGHKNSLTESAFLSDYVKQFGEALNVFYVACTRAVQRLSILLQAKDSSRTDTSWHQLLWSLRQDCGQAWDETWRSLMSRGALQWIVIPEDTPETIVTAGNGH